MKRSFGVLMIGVVALVLLCSAYAVDAAERLIRRGDRITIVYDRTLLEAAEYFQENFTSIEDELERLLQMPLRTGIRLILVQDRQFFESMGPSPYASAFAVPQDHSIAMYVPSASLKPFLLRDTFRHELCHIILHDNIQTFYLPRWLEEGICQWVSGSLGEFLAGSESELAVTIGATSNAFPLEQLARNFPSERIALLTAYHQSRKFVEYLSQAYGRQPLIALLGQLRNGTEINTATYRTYGRSLGELEHEWAQKSHSASAALVWLSRNLYETLFAVTLFVAVAALILRAIKQRARHQVSE